MSLLKYTLIADGSSDKVLMNVIKWLLDDLFPSLPNEGKFADFRGLKNPPKKGDIAAQIARAGEYYPSDLVFYHRDAEIISKDIIKQRKAEIYDAVGNAGNIVCVVPVVMMESWLLFDELAIKKAAENKNFSGDMQLPILHKMEDIKEPKTFLHQLLKTVSCKKGRNLNTFNVHSAVHLVAENISDFSPLRALSAFKVFENDLKTGVNKVLPNLQQP